MNFSEMAENMGLEQDEFEELVELFVNTSTSHLEKLQTAIDKKNTQQAVEAAHYIKGAAGNLGFTRIYDLAKTIEDKARQNLFEGSNETLESIRDGFDQIVEMLRWKKTKT